MNKKIFTSIVTVAVALPITFSCNKLSDVDFDIKFKDTILSGYVGEKYDFGNDVLVKESGLNYTMKAEYYDYTAKELKELKVDNFTFTPTVKSEVIVTITANNKKYIRSKKTSIPISVKADAIDALLTDGYSSWADEGISKSINTDSKYVKEGCGNTSIAIKYYGSTTWKNQGCTFICPNNFRCLDYWTDKEWNNAILTFWVYNPTDYDFEFQLRVQNNHDGDTTKVDIDWGDPKNTPQYAKAGKWTQIFFSMNKININRPLRITEDESYKDYLICKTYWYGTPDDGSPYTWNMIVDGIDVVDASKYPDVDTVPYETIAQGWENMAKDTGWQQATTCKYTNDACHKAGYDKSTKGLELTFNNGKDPKDIGYAVAFSPEDENKSGGISELPDFGKGSITADIKFSEDITDQTVDFFATDEKWAAKKISTITLTDLGDGWKRLKFGLDKVSAFKDIGKVIRFGMTFNGVTSENRNTAKVYVDNVFYDENGNEPAPTYIRGNKFTAGKDLTIDLPKTFDTTKDTLNIDVKFLSDDTKHFNISILNKNDWNNYIGYYEISPTTTTETGLEGLTVTKLDDGYTRLTFNLSATKATGTKPATVDQVYVRGNWTDASGYIDVNMII